MRISLHRLAPLLLLVGMVAPAGTAAAQESGTADPLAWEVGRASAGWCVHFLMEAKEAKDGLARGHRLVLASEATNLPPALQRILQEEPKYADWVPSEVCTYFVDAVWAGARRFDKGDKNTPLALTYWGIAAAEGQGPWQGQMSLRVVGTNSFPLVRMMEVQNMHLDRIAIDRDPDPIAPEDSQYVIKMEGATITFIGHQNPDTVATLGPVKETGVFDGPINSVWTMAFSYTPDRVATLGGSVKIVGKRALAKALNASPIRLLGTSLIGGKGSVGFTRSVPGKS